MKAKTLAITLETINKIQKKINGDIFPVYFVEILNSYLKKLKFTSEVLNFLFWTCLEFIFGITFNKVKNFNLKYDTDRFLWSKFLKLFIILLIQNGCHDIIN